MEEEFNIDEIRLQIQAIRHAAEKLKNLEDDFPAISKNAARILANTSMMEINLGESALD
jgi:hypothetical protein